MTSRSRCYPTKHLLVSFFSFFLSFFFFSPKRDAEKSTANVAFCLFAAKQVACIFSV